MRIAFFVPSCTPENSHGRYVMEIARQLGRTHSITVYAGAHSPQLGPPVRCRFLPVPNRPAFARIAALWSASIVSVPGKRYDIVHVQGADAPVGNVVTAHCCNAAMRSATAEGDTLPRRLNYALGIRAERYCLTKQSTRIVIAVSGKVKTEIETYYDVCPGRTVVIPPGVDLNSFHRVPGDGSRQEIREQFGLQTEDFVITFVGGDYRLKGLVTLLEAVHLSPPNVKVIALGVRPDRDLTALLSKYALTDRVKFLRKTPDPAPCYSAGDCFVLPTRYDTFSLATLEAMASGLPVIVSNAAGVSEHLTDGLDSMLLEEPADVTGLARKIARLMNDEAWRMALGEQARKTAEQFSWERVTEHTLAAYRLAL